MRLAKGTLTYGLGLMLNRMVSFLLLPLFTRYLTPEDYGVSALIGLLMVAMSGVFSLGTGNSMGICYFEETDRSARPAIVWTTAVLLAVNATVLVLVLWSFAPPLTKILFQKVRYADILRIAAVALGLQTILDPFGPTCVWRRRPRPLWLFLFWDSPHSGIKRLSDCFPWEGSSGTF